MASVNIVIQSNKIDSKIKKINNSNSYSKTSTKSSTKVKTKKNNLYKVHFLQSNNQTQSQNQIKKNKNSNKCDYATINNTNYSSFSSNDIYKAKQDSLKEKKLYEERVKILKNHINMLKKNR